MAAGNIIVGTERKGGTRHPIAPARAWKTLLGFGTLFTLVALIDIGLAIYPANLSDPATRFATLSGVAVGLPLLSVGLLSLLGGGLGLDVARTVTVGAALNALFALLLLGAAFWLGMSYGPTRAALPVETRGPATAGLVRGLAFFTGFFAVHVMAAVVGFRTMRGPNPA
jgi:hypothetical protein